MTKAKAKAETPKRKLDRLDNLNEQLKSLLEDERKLQVKNAEQIIRNDDVFYAEEQRFLRMKQRLDELEKKNSELKTENEKLKEEIMASKIVQIPPHDLPQFIPCYPRATRGFWNHMERWMEGKP